MSLSKLAGDARRQMGSSFKRDLARQCRSAKRLGLTPLRASDYLAGARPLRVSRGIIVFRREREGGQPATENRNEVWLTRVHMKPKERNDGNGKEGAKG
jgi:hypothetical protein